MLVTCLADGSGICIALLILCSRIVIAALSNGRDVVASGLNGGGGIALGGYASAKNKDKEYLNKCFQSLDRIGRPGIVVKRERRLTWPEPGQSKVNSIDIY